MRKNFNFYQEFYESISALEEKDKFKIIEAVCEFVFNNKEIELNGLANTIFKLVKPQLIDRMGE